MGRTWPLAWRYRPPANGTWCHPVMLLSVLNAQVRQLPGGRTESPARPSAGEQLEQPEEPAPAPAPEAPGTPSAEPERHSVPDPAEAPERAGEGGPRDRSRWQKVGAWLCRGRIWGA
jgi:hypothetical protein